MAKCKALTGLAVKGLIQTLDTQQIHIFALLVSPSWDEINL